MRDLGREDVLAVVMTVAEALDDDKDQWQGDGQAEESRVGALSLALGRAGVGILSLTPELATLEDLFFRLTEDGHGENGEVQHAALAGAQQLVETA